MESDSLYASDTVADAPGGGIVVAQLLSHLVLAAAVFFAMYRRSFMIGANGLVSLFASLNYHACRGGLLCLGLALDDWRRADHFTALSLGASLGLALAKKHPDDGSRFFEYLMPPVVFFAVLAHPFQLQSALIVVVYVALVAVDTFLWRGHHLVPPDARRYRPRSLFVGGLLLVAAVACYAFDGGGGASGRGDSVLSGVLHVAWHVLIGAAIIAIVNGLPTQDAQTLPDKEEEEEEEEEKGNINSKTMERSRLVY